MRLTGLFGNANKLKNVSAGWRMSKAGLLQHTGFDKLSLTAFINCQHNDIALLNELEIKKINIKA